MLKFILTYLEPKEDRESRLKSICEACFWVLDEKDNRLKDPFFKDIKVNQVVASFPQKTRNDARYLSKTLINEIIAELGLEYRLTNKEDMKKILEEAISNLSSNLNSKKNYIVKETEHLNQSYYVSQVYLPNVLTDKMQPHSYRNFTGQNISFKRNVEFNVNFPFTVFPVNDLDNLDENLEKIIDNEFPLKFNQLETEIIEKQRGLSFDFETKNWKKIDVLSRLMNLDKDKLIEVAKKLNLNLEELKWKNKGWIVREIQEAINKNKNESITIASLSNIEEGYNYLITTFNVDENELYIKDPISKKNVKFEIIKVKNQDELMNRLNEIVKDFEPLFIYGHNHLAFDLNIGKELPNESIKLGIDYREPKKVFSVGGFRQLVINPGRFGIDMMLYSQQSMKNKDNTLDSVFEALFGLENRSKKTLSQLDLIIETRKAENGDKSAALKVLSYAAMDGLKSYYNGEATKREHIILSKVFNTYPERVDATSWKRLSNEYHTKRFFIQKHYFPQDFDRLKIPLSDNAQQLFNKHSLDFKDFDLDEFEFKVIEYNIKKKHDKKIKTKKGLFDSYVIKITPSIKALSQILNQDENLEELLNEYENSEGQKKLRLSYAIENILKLPVYLLLCEDPKQFNEFFPENKLSEIGFKNLKSALFQNLIKVSEFFREGRLINYNNDIILLEKNEISNQLINKALEDSLIVYLGEAYALSGDKGTFIGKTKDWEFMFGFSSPKSKKGEKFPIESSFYESFIEDLLFERNNEKALYTFLEHLDYIKSSEFLSKISRISDSLRFEKSKPILLDELIEKSLIKESELDSNLIIEHEAKRNFYDFSVNYNSGKKTAQEMSNSKKGDIIRYTYHRDVLLEKMLGKRKNSQNTYIYSQGKFSRLIYWAFLYKNPEKRKLLDKLINDNLFGYDANIIKSIIE
ncbi:MAG: hypothetical protein PWR32_600 [Candidatus Woesearchaeota archaeon]|nr:hypothetical protein [Candidatus Woesearchaeota archaeon]